MTSNEINHEDWKEIRARVDSIANGVFLIAGGALTLSITAVIGFRQNGVALSGDSTNIITDAWHYLLVAMLVFLTLKCYLVLVSMLRGWLPTVLFNRINPGFNAFGLVGGIAGLVYFIIGMIQIVNGAVSIVNA